MPVIAARVIGVPEVEIDGGAPPAALRWRKHFGLCLLLWCSPDRRLSRDTALAMLWGDRPEQDARHSLNEALRVIRKSCGAECVATPGDMLQWTGSIALDTQQFASAEALDPVRAAKVVRGNWCEGFTIPGATEFEHWLEDERRSWRARLVAVLAAASARLADAGELTPARELAYRAQHIDPLNEAAAHAVIRVLALSGDRTAALTEAEAFAGRLREELDVSLGNETALLHRRVAEMRVPKPHPDASRVAPAVPLVGRSAELAKLLEAVRVAMRTDSTRLLMIEGEAGAGRTRLLEEVTIRAALEGAATLTVRAVISDEAQAGAGLRAIAGSGLAQLPGAAALGREALAAMIDASPAWAERFHVESGHARLPLEHALVSALRGISGERPLVLAIDDLGVLDAESVHMIPALLRGLHDVPVVVMVTLHPGDVRAHVDALRRHVDRPERGVQVRVGPLSQDEIAEATIAVLPEWDSDAQQRLARRIFAESAGLPAIAVGILEAVVRGLALDDLRAPWPAPNRTMDATLPSPMPDALTAAVRMRFHQLGEVERRMLSLVAVAGSALQPDQLSVLANVERDLVDGHLDALEAERWLVTDARGYRYRARAVGTLVASELLTPGQRNRLRQQLAAH